MRARLQIGALGAVLLAVAVIASASGSARIVGNCSHSQVRPSSVVLACADANASFTHLHWSSFGGTTAHATGNYTFNDCTPTCVAGHVHSYPVTITFSAPKRCPDGFNDYRRAIATYDTSKRPSGAQGAAGEPPTMELICPLKT
jgi:hypothetical protein